MKKVAVIFIIAVILPSLALAWLAMRSLRDQQYVLERQQSLLYQRMTDSLAETITDFLAQQQREFAGQVEDLASNQDAYDVGAEFDNEIRRRWPLAEVGFCVTLSGTFLSPLPNTRAEATTFYANNSGFLGNREPAEVYGNAGPALNGLSGANNSMNLALRSLHQLATFGGSFDGGSGGGGGETAGGASAGRLQSQAPADMPPAASAASALPAQAATSLADSASVPMAQRERMETSPAQLDRNAVVENNNPAFAPAAKVPANPLGQFPQAPPPAAPPASDKFTATNSLSFQNGLNYKLAQQQQRKVIPQEVADYLLNNHSKDAPAEYQNLSRVIPAETEFRQLVGNDRDGMLARFLQNRLKLMFWHRLKRAPDLIFGAQLNLDRVVDDLHDLVQPDPAVQNEVCLALLDDNAKPAVLSREGFTANWKHPFVATEIGDALPHWEVAAYLVNPDKLTRIAGTAELTLGLLVAVLVLAIVIGGWLIVTGLNAELKFARQKTDFVSNVSHELKTPLTSIRMFSELLVDGRVADPARQRSYLQIITAEAARLTRLINNVLDFSHLERGEKKYNFQPADLAEITRAAAETFRPHLEANGFKFACELPAVRIPIRGDADALSQVIVNLLSNAEKYSPGAREITLQLVTRPLPLPHAEVRVLDRGSGVPRGSEEMIFEKFYRAHDSLSSGIQGSGLGLTIARQIARAHGGDVVFEPREGGGSCFCLRLPLLEAVDPAAATLS